MERIPPPEFERRVHQELQQLPGVPAPATLIPSVLAAVRRRAEKFWYQQGWVAWPLWAKTAFFCIFVAGTALLTWGIQNPPVSSVADLQQSVHKHAPLLTVLGNTSVVLGNVAGSIIQTYQLWLYGAAAVLLLMYAFCVTLGTLSFRMLSRFHL